MNRSIRSAIMRRTTSASSSMMKSGSISPVTSAVSEKAADVLNAAGCYGGRVGVAIDMLDAAAADVGGRVGPAGVGISHAIDVGCGGDSATEDILVSTGFHSGAIR